MKKEVNDYLDAYVNLSILGFFFKLIFWGIVALLIFIFAGCDDETYLLEDGKYVVSVIAVSTTDPFVEEGEQWQMEWLLKNQGKNAIFTHQETKRVWKYYQNNEQLILDVFDDWTKHPECPDNSGMTSVLEPNKDKTGFVGQSFVYLNFCAYYDPNKPEKTHTEEWWVDHTLSGTKKKLDVVLTLK